MTKKQFDKLKRGDVVVNRGSGQSYIIHERKHTIGIPKEADFYIGVRTVTISNTEEWERVKT